MMCNNYADCCSKLEKIVSKRKIYGAVESSFRLYKKNSRLNESYSCNGLIKDAKEKIKKIPFICAGSANKSHHMGINIQTTMSIINQFPGHITDGMGYSSSSSHNFLTESKSHKSEASLSQKFNEMQTCPARSEEQLIIIEEDKTNNGSIPDPWMVKQADRNTNAFETRFMDSYYKVMTPFVNRKHNKSMEPDENPYTKSNNVSFYEQLCRNMEELKMTMIAMNNLFVMKTEKYRKLYEQYVRNEDGNLIPVLHQIENELNALKSKVEEAVDVYKEAAFVNVQEANSSDSDMLAHSEQSVPKETTTTRMVKVLRRVQILQDKLKNGHFLQGSGDHQT